MPIGSEHPGPAATLAVITGASSGIGQATACALAARGYRTLLIARRLDRLRPLAERLGMHAASLAVQLDLSEPRHIEGTLGPILAEHGPVALLINNAGFGLYRPFLDHAPAEHHRLMQVNYFSAVTLTRMVLPGMLRRHDGHVINIASISAKVGPWGHSGYAASKAALVTLTQTLAAEYAHEGVRFSYVNPGIVDTEYFRKSSFAPLAKQLSHRAISPELVAKKIVGLLDRPRLELCIPAHYRLLDWIRALSPALAHHLVARHSRPRVEVDGDLATEPPPRDG
jgi:short-subunit dehydrogenase